MNHGQYRIAAKLVEGIHQVFQGFHPGYRDVHANGRYYAGTFKATPEAKKLRIEWLFKRRDGRDDYTYSSTLHFVAGNQDMFAGQRELRDP